MYNYKGSSTMVVSSERRETDSKRTNHRSGFAWRNIILLSILHIMGLYAAYLLFIEASWKTIIFALLHGIGAGIGVTAGAHRLWCHRSYKAKLPLRILLAILNSTAVQTPIYEWCRDHRVHHKYCETDADPHNAKRGFFFSHVGWLLVRKHPQVVEKGRTIDCSDVLADPVVRFQRKYYIPLTLFVAFVLPTYVPMKLWNETFRSAFFVTAIGRYVTLLHFTWFVNSIAHMYGFRPYDNRINARQNWLVSLLVVGEGFHNFHHTFPWDYKISELGWFLNPGTVFIDVMAFFGLAYDLKTVPQSIIEKVKENNRKREQKILHCDFAASVNRSYIM